MAKGWIQAVILVGIFGFTVLGYMAARTYQAEPPIPDRVVSESGTELFTGEDVRRGQEVFLRNGVMQFGSIFGHGAYLGPDFTADYLHRGALHVEAAYGGEGTDARHRTIEDFRTNTYDPATGTVVYSDAQADAYDALVEHYHVLDAGLTIDREGPEVGATDDDGARAEGQRLDDIAAASDAAVEQDLDVAADCIDNRAEGPDRRRGAVEIVAAVVGHGDGRHACVHCPSGVVDAHHALAQERAVPLSPQPGDVVPGPWRRLHPFAVGPEERRGRAAVLRRQVRRGQIGQIAGPQEPGQPRWAQQRFGRESDHRQEIESFGMWGLPQSRPWENDQSSVTITPATPAALARPSRSTIESRSPIR